MNYLKKSIFMAMTATALVFAMGACSSNNNKETKKETKVAPAKAGQHVEIRYIDEDSVVKNYNLAKDFQEMETRLNNEIENAQKKYQDQINNFLTNALSNAEKKYNSGQASQDQFKPVSLPDGRNTALLAADANKYEQMLQNAQNELSKLQQNGANQLQQSNKQLNDSVDNFLKDYAAKNHYDVILKKAASLYINPSLDVTDEVIEGLNKRYTKVAKK